MTKQEKLLGKLLNPHAVMTWQELVTLLCGLGYRQAQGSGSRVKFDNGNALDAISLHRPHPGNELKVYVKRLVAEHLRKGRMIR
ncbi:MAG: type II toxin-antitoxin system HicA family toxin [Zoogloeaceae bacterium]|jgi:hypothetical protein|nr:type II toxin-antitoxin system HicA family toxin [Zoogloeaceae bacterium]